MTRYLRPDEVEAVAAALADISVDQLLARVDIETVRTAGIYRWGPDADLEQVEWVVRDDFPRLVNFFTAAALEHNFVILSLD